MKRRDETKIAQRLTINETSQDPFLTLSMQQKLERENIFLGFSPACFRLEPGLSRVHIWATWSTDELLT